MKNKRPIKPVKVNRASRSIAGIYLLISAFWIFFSDRLLLGFSPDPKYLSLLQTLKGWVFVLCTAVLLHFLIRRTLNRMRIVEQNASESAERYRHLFEKNPHPMWIYDLETLSILAVNNAAIEHYGYTHAEFLSLTIKDIRPPDDISALLKKVEEMNTGDGSSGVWRHRKKDGTLISVEITSDLLDFDGRRAKLVLAHDVTEKLKAEERLHGLNRTLRVLSRCNETLVRATSEKELLHGVCDNLVTLGGYLLAWVGFPEKDEDRRVEMSALAGDDGGLLGRLNLSWGDNDRGQGPTAKAIREGRTVVSRDMKSDQRFSHMQTLIGSLGISAAISLPLHSEEEIVGAMTLYSTDDQAFDQEEVQLLSELAEDLAYGIVSLRTAVARRQAEESLKLRNRAIEASSNGIMICDAQDTEMPIQYVNPAFERITGFGADEVLGLNPRFLSGEDTEQKGVIDIQESIHCGLETEAVVRNYRKDGSLFWNELSVAPVRDAVGNVTHYVSVFNDITERKRYEEQLEHHAGHDPLTDLLNRNLLIDRLEQSIVYAERSHRLLAVLLLDLDRFKVINESLGHGQGDELLRMVARRLSGCVRPGDTVARLGGDEFVIALAELAEADDVGMVGRKIQAALIRPFDLAGRELFLTASIGISFFPRDGRNGEILIRNADIAMYRAKAEGGNQFRFFAPEMNQRVMETLEMEADLRRALEKEEFLLHYQPTVDLASGRISGCEALVRWRHPKKGLVPPGVFIPLAEETGLIVPLGEWVLREACRQFREWRNAGVPVITVAANLSARQFRQADLAERVQQIIEDTGMDPRKLILELTESMIMQDPAGAAETMGRLKKLGVGLSLDDFGTGYSSLNYLRNFPVDCLKIDRSFITDVNTDAGAAAVTNSVVAIAHSLKLTAIAEGVETREQLAFVRESRCDGLQGYYFSKPLPAEEFVRLLKEDRRLERRSAARGRAAIKEDAI